MDRVRCSILLWREQQSPHTGVNDVSVGHMQIDASCLTMRWGGGSLEWVALLVMGRLHDGLWRTLCDSFIYMRESDEGPIL